jgi:hypothetical protein
MTARRQLTVVSAIVCFVTISSIIAMHYMWPRSIEHGWDTYVVATGTLCVCAILARHIARQ